MKIAVFAACLAAVSACSPESTAQALQDPTTMETIGSSPGGAIYFLDTASIVDNAATATREAVIVTDNSAYAATKVDDPTAQVSSRNRVIVRCAAGEIRVASSVIQQKDGHSKTMNYTEQSFPFLHPAEDRFESKVIKAICAR